MCLSENAKLTLTGPFLLEKTFNIIASNSTPLWHLQPGWNAGSEHDFTYLPTRGSRLWEPPKNRSFQRVIFLVIRFGGCGFFLNGKCALDRWNQKELLQTPKNREAHNILNICHATHASQVNFCARRQEREGLQPFAATPLWHPPPVAMPRRLLLLPRKASSKREYMRLTTLLPLYTPSHRRKASKPR